MLLSDCVFRFSSRNASSAFVSKRAAQAGAGARSSAGAAAIKVRLRIVPPARAATSRRLFHGDLRCTVGELSDFIPCEPGARFGIAEQIGVPKGGGDGIDRVDMRRDRGMRSHADGRIARRLVGQPTEGMV